jgi:hypothetical protein
VLPASAGKDLVDEGRTCVEGDPCLRLVVDLALPQLIDAFDFEIDTVAG